MVGTFQRIDIPVLPQLLQYEFVLFTGRVAAVADFNCPLLPPLLQLPSPPLLTPLTLRMLSHGGPCKPCKPPLCTLFLSHPPLQADCDVYFRQHIKLVDWGTPLPTAVGMR